MWEFGILAPLRSCGVRAARCGEMVFLEGMGLQKRRHALSASTDFSGDQSESEGAEAC
jgi:hypothetical protein